MVTGPAPCGLGGDLVHRCTPAWPNLKWEALCFLEYYRSLDLGSLTSWDLGFKLPQGSGPRIPGSLELGQKGTLGSLVGSQVAGSLTTAKQSQTLRDFQAQ